MGVTPCWSGERCEWGDWFAWGAVLGVLVLLVLVWLLVLSGTWVSSKNMHMTRGATVGWTIVLLSEPTMSIPIS